MSGSASVPIHPRHRKAPVPYCEVHGSCAERATEYFVGQTVFEEPVTVWSCEGHASGFAERHPEMTRNLSRF